jgi:hypothetical protein
MGAMRFLPWFLALAALSLVAARLESRFWFRVFQGFLLTAAFLLFCRIAVTGYLAYVFALAILWQLLRWEKIEESYFRQARGAGFFLQLGCLAALACYVWR